MVGPGADRNWSAPATRRSPSHCLLEHRSRSPNPLKTDLFDLQNEITGRIAAPSVRSW
jgi:hypothetical protein